MVFRGKRFMHIWQKKNSRQRAWWRGIFAEILTIIFLFFKGYQLLQWRYKTKVGEVDIIARKNNCLCFLEVKYRSTYAEAAESLQEHQKKRIIRAAKFYLKGHPFLGHKRFDAILLNRWYWPKHLKGAWVNDDVYTQF